MDIPIDWKRKDLECLSPLILLIFEELDSKRTQSLGSYGDEMEISELSMLVDF